MKRGANPFLRNELTSENETADLCRARCRPPRTDSRWRSLSAHGLRSTSAVAAARRTWVPRHDGDRFENVSTVAPSRLRPYFTPRSAATRTGARAAQRERSLSSSSPAPTPTSEGRSREELRASGSSRHADQKVDFFKFCCCSEYRTPCVRTLLDCNAYSPSRRRVLHRPGALRDQGDPRSDRGAQVRGDGGAEYLTRLRMRLGRLAVNKLDVCEATVAVPTAKPVALPEICDTS